MKPFEILSHTADVRLKIYGSSKEEIFRNALKGMGQILGPVFNGSEFEQPNKTHKVKVDSPDLAALLVDFLNEVVSLLSQQKILHFKSNFAKLTDTHLEAELEGMSVKELGEEIKAATYHELYFKESPGAGWEAMVIFDI